MPTITNTRTVPTRYGSGQHMADAYVADQSDGTSWYAVHGSTVANLCATEDIAAGVWVEEIYDLDIVTWCRPITSERELEAAVA